MSWIENIQNDFVITLGDGTEFRPLWLNAVKTKGYNIAEFEFPNINGTLVKRTTVKGGRYSLEIYFQGEDNLVTAAAFDKSSEDPRPWTILHPFYGSINVQPSELIFDNTKFNVTKITGTIIETIIDDNPKTTIKPEDNIGLLKDENDLELINAFDGQASPKDASWLTSQLNKYYKNGKKLKSSQEQSQDYFNKFNTATASINKIASAPQSAMRSVQAVINAPGLFIANLKDKTAALSDQFDQLKSSVSGITSRANKKMFSTNGAAIISAHALAAVTPGGALLLTRSEVFALAENLLDNYNEFIVKLDSLQTENNGTPESFIPDFETYLGLNNIVVSAITGLFLIASDSRQERILILEDDTDLITLTHRLYGLDSFDENIDELQKNNAFALNEILELKKGTRVSYFI